MMGIIGDSNVVFSCICKKLLFHLLEFRHATNSMTYCVINNNHTKVSCSQLTVSGVTGDLC